MIVHTNTHQIKLDMVQLDLENLLPHRSPMLLLSRVTFETSDSVGASCTIGEQCKLFTDQNGDVGGWIILELMAQTISVYAGLKNKHPNEPARIGFLLGTRQFSCSRAVIHTGETIDITARCLFFAEPELPSQFECTAAIDGELIAQSNLTVFQPKEFQPWIA